MRITGPKGRPIDGAKSMAGEVFAAFDWRDMVLGRPGPEIERKARRLHSRLAAFPLAEHPALTRQLGHYSDVQSINSEDTVTASVFGGAHLASWLPAVLTTAFGPASERPLEWTLSLWRRTKHPKTGQTSHGPEADVLLDGVIAGVPWRYLVEAKWSSDVGEGQQGMSGLVSQLDMREHGARDGAAGPAVGAAQRGVLLVVPSPARYLPATHAVFSRYFEVSGDAYRPTAAAAALGAQAVTWESIGQAARAAGDGELADYLEWRLSYLPLRRRESRRPG